jgi:transposase
VHTRNMPLPPAPKLSLTGSDRKRLLEISRHRSTPRGIILRVDIVLGAAEGIANHVLARNLSTSLPTVLLWRRRFNSGGLAAVLEDRPRSGRPKQISPEQEETIVKATMKTTPKDATHWSVRAMATSQKVSPATVQRIWKKHKLQPHRVESFKFSKTRNLLGKCATLRGSK